MGQNYGSGKDLNEILRKLEQQGWRLEKGRGGHWKCYAPDGVSMVTLQGSQGGGRSLANAKAQLRRAGADI